jgi:hypothetical protein
MNNQTEKQKTKAKFLCLVLLLSAQLVYCPLSALAAQVIYTPPSASGGGALVAKLPMDKLGSIALPHGRAAINGNDIELTIVPEYQFDRRTILNGFAFNTKITASEKQTLISGIAYFNDGEWLRYIDDEKAYDILQTDQGEVTGKITGFDNNELQVDMADGTHRQIASASVSDIRSPRAFAFTVPITQAADFDKLIAQGLPIETEAEQITMKPAEKIYHLAALKKDSDLQGDGDTSTAKLVFVSTALSLVELGTLAPLIAVPLGTQGVAATARQNILRSILYPQTFGPVYAPP